MKNNESSIGGITIRPTRRDFLKVAGAAAGSLVLGGIIGAEARRSFNVSDHPAKVPDIAGKDELITGTEIQMEEIKGYRKALGLDGLPQEMIHLKGNHWEDGSSVFENDLPNQDLSYGEYTAEVVSKLFGKISTQLVRGNRSNPTSPLAIAFSPTDRFCIFSPEVHRISIEDDFVNYILHEAGGHGSDPSVSNTNYPDEVLVKVEHGKWRALTQIFSVPDQFLNNPGDKMYPALKRKLGETLGRAFINNPDLSGLLDSVGVEQVQQAIGFIAYGQGRKIKEIKFNKRACGEIGKVVMQLVRQGTLGLKGDLKEAYRSAFEDNVVREIYAEMMKYAVLYPEKVNDMVTGGMAEVLGAINGRPVDLDGLRVAILHPGSVILARNAAEAQAMRQLEEGSKSHILSSEEMAIIAKQRAEMDRQERQFQEFIKDGKLPNSLYIPSHMSDKVNRFIFLYLSMETKLPGIASIDIINDDNFDPNMNLWDIEDLAYAIDTSFIRGLIQATQVSDQIYEEIVKKEKILEALYISTPFYSMYGKG